jgi:hypothetical protein
MVHKFALIPILVVFIMALGSVASSQDGKPSDYIIILDASSSMNNEMQFPGSGFMQCDSRLRDSADHEIPCKKIKIAEASLICFMKHYAKPGDEVALIIVDKDPKDIEDLKFYSFEEIEEVYKKINSIESGSYERSPVVEALSRAIELYDSENNAKTEHKILVATDFDFICARKSNEENKSGMCRNKIAEEEFCSNLENLRLKIGYMSEDMKIDSILFFGLADKELKPTIEEMDRNCIGVLLPIATVLDLTGEEWTFDIIDKIEAPKSDIPELLRDNIRKKDEIDRLNKKIQEPDNSAEKSALAGFLADLELPIRILLFVSIVLLFSSVWTIIRSRQ